MRRVSIIKIAAEYRYETFVPIGNVNYVELSEEDFFFLTNHMDMLNRDEKLTEYGKYFYTYVEDVTPTLLDLLTELKRKVALIEAENKIKAEKQKENYLKRKQRQEEKKLKEAKKLLEEKGLI